MKIQPWVIKLLFCTQLLFSFYFLTRSPLLYSSATRSHRFHFTHYHSQEGKTSDLETNALEKGSSTCQCITRAYCLDVWSLCLVCRTCCSVQTGEPCERNGSSSISCRPRAKHNSPVMITHRLLQITLRNPKNQRLQVGANRRESGASGEGSCPDESGAELVRI